MSRKIIALLTLPLLIILSSWTKDSTYKSNLDDEIAMTNQLIQMINDHRLNVGKPLLIRNATADKLAEEHTVYMISQNAVSSDNFIDRLEVLEQKENAEEVAENMVVEINVEEAMNACLTANWLKVNVEGDFTHTGIAIRSDHSGRYYFTQIFYK